MHRQKVNRISIYFLIILYNDNFILMKYKPFLNIEYIWNETIIIFLDIRKVITLEIGTLNVWENVIFYVLSLENQSSTSTFLISPQASNQISFALFLFLYKTMQQISLCVLNLATFIFSAIPSWIMNDTENISHKSTWRKITFLSGQKRIMTFVLSETFIFCAIQCFITTIISNFSTHYIIPKNYAALLNHFV